MTDAQDASNEADPGPDYDPENDVDPTTQVPPAIPDEAQGTTIPSSDDYADEDEVLPDVTINLYINDGPGDVTATPAISQAILTDIYGNPITQSNVIDYTTTLTDSLYTDLITNGTETDGKGLFGKFIWFKISRNYKQTKEKKRTEGFLLDGYVHVNQHRSLSKKR
ncbi:unnamed protein product [Adineta ricciae]|nr:unnamed protein product [Adineta ricciae]